MTIYFGLNINRNLTDISNRFEALNNLNLIYDDLNVIRGISTENVSDKDIQSLSNLDFDFEKNLGSLFYETELYDSLTTNFYDENAFIRNNIFINGQLIGGSLKYYIQNPGEEQKLAEISTSRISSWSTFDSPVVASSPIFYGGRVNLEGSIELSKLTIDESNITEKRFESEIPTHRIEASIGGQNVYFYAMKGIPLSFTGFFRDTPSSLIAVINQLGNIRPSWTIENLDDSNLEYVYENRLFGTTSQISFSDSTSRLRKIDFYYPVDNIRQLYIRNVALRNLPEIIMSNLQIYHVNNNDLLEFPDLSQYANLIDFNISFNNLTRAKLINDRKISSIVDKLPNSIKTLSVGNCYEDDSTLDLSTKSNLINLNVSSNFTERRLKSEFSPIVPSTIEAYDIRGNQYSKIHSSVMNSTTLKSIRLSGNNLNQNDLKLDSNNLESFESVSNSVPAHNLVDFSNKQNLTIINHRSQSVIVSPVGSGIPTSIDNTLQGCSSLETVFMYRLRPTGSNTIGKIPNLSGCNSLKRIEMFDTPLNDATNEHVIDKTRFDSCRPIIERIRFRSSLFSNNTIHPEAFDDMFSLFWIMVVSNKRGITGDIPNFKNCGSLRYVWLYNNNLSGNISNFSDSPRLYYIHLYNNNLSGDVPNFTSSDLRFAYLGNNNLTLPSIETTSLRVLHLQRNNIDKIPDMSSLTSLVDLQLWNQKVPITEYASGSFAGITSIRSLILANNNMTQGTVDDILSDLNKNYLARPRSGVTVNLIGNATPSTVGLSIVTDLRSVGWNILL